MDTQYFPHFLRKIFGRDIEISNEQAIELGNEFSHYITEKFSNENRLEKLEEICDISPITVLRREDKPQYTRGYHPALIIHFTNFLKEIEQN